MVECPKCHGSIEIADNHFGTLFTCPNCSSLFFVGWDGKPEVDETPRGPQADIPPISQEEPPALDPLHLDPLPLDPMPLDPLPSLDFGVVPIVPESTSVQNFTQEIERFSNLNQEVTPLTYDLFIRGLDIPKQIEVVREAIQDSRFGWDPDQILEEIKEGVLVLRNLSPIKCSLLVQRIKFSDIDVEWRQHALA